MKITVEVEIDPKAWATEFDMEPGRVQEDVQAYFEAVVDDQLDRIGLRRSA